MVDIDTHKIIDMIEERDLETVKTWLATYPNLSVVSRDGSVTYKNAITESHPNAIQVSDRFHILKILTGYCKDYLKKHLNNRVIVDELTSASLEVMEKSYKEYTLQEKYEHVKAAILTGTKVSPACKKYHLDIRTYKKIDGFTDTERFNYLATYEELKHHDTVTNKMKLVNEVRKSYDEIGSMRQVAKLHGISRNALRKYLDVNFSPVHANKGVKRKSILDPYKDIIGVYVHKGAKSKDIIEALIERGYTGSEASIRRYLSNIIKENVNQGVAKKQKYEYIEREKLMKLLYHRVDKVKGLTEGIVEKVYLRDSIFKQVIELIESFRNLMKHKKIEKLQGWIDKAKALEISEINSFINGLSRDIDAVKNAIIYDYNNGLAEGKVNKIKVTKRIMYGRCGFKLLKEKSLRLEF
jgi:transposase